MTSIIEKFIQKMVNLKMKCCGEKTIIRLPFFLKGEQYIEIGSHSSINRYGRIEAWDYYAGRRYKPSIVIGNNVSISHNCHIGAINKVVIEDYVLIGSNVLIIDHSHGKIIPQENIIPPKKRKLYSRGAVIIRKNVWIGDNVVILPGVIVGENSIIGANAVVTRDVSPNVVVGGIPAKVIKYL